MKTKQLVIGGLVLVAACATQRAPSQQVESAVAAVSAAKQQGAAESPQGKLHLQLAEEQLARSRTSWKHDELAEADVLAERARGDAELAKAIAQREKTAKELAAFGAAPGR